jgi:hypothetical protein
MLKKRTHILFDEETFDMLAYLASQKQESIGELIRSAVKKTYKKELSVEEKRRKAIDEILSYKPIDISPYKAADFVKMGRKFGS